jgi:UDP-N-acetylglucosamine enolpyruvyl transferase
MAPKEGNSIVKHGVLDERLNVHGVKHLKVADLSICPDNVGCNTCESPASSLTYMEADMRKTRPPF